MNCKQAGLFLSGATLLLLLPACNGIFEGIYDMPTSETGNEYGFILIDEEARTGRIYIDATDYTEWHYVDLQGKQVTTTQVGDAAPETWDLPYTDTTRRPTAAPSGKARQGLSMRFPLWNRFPKNSGWPMNGPPTASQSTCHR